MGKYREEIEITGTKQSKKVLAMFDSGAFRNYIRRELEDGETPDDIGFHAYEGRHDTIMANGCIANGEGIRFKTLSIKDIILDELRFVVMEGLNDYAIIGAENMQKLGINLDLSEDQIVIPDK